MQSQLNEKGFSIVEILVGAAILSIIAVGMATVMANFSKDQRAVEEKFGILEVQNIMHSLFTDDTNCMSQLDQGSPALDVTDPAFKVSYPKILMGSAAGSPEIAKVGSPLLGFGPGRMVVTSIELGHIVATGNPNVYTGDLIINLDSNTMTRSFKPIKITTLFSVTPNPSLANAKFANCGPAALGKPSTMGDWMAMPTNASNLAPSDGMVAVTSCNNCGIKISTAPSVAGSCAGVPLVERMFVSARDKYGQGRENADLPIKKGECFQVQMTNVHQSVTGANADNIFFRPL